MVRYNSSRAASIKRLWDFQSELDEIEARASHGEASASIAAELEKIVADLRSPLVMSQHNAQYYYPRMAKQITNIRKKLAR